MQTALAAIFTLLPPTGAAARNPFSPLPRAPDAQRSSAASSAAGDTATAKTDEAPVMHLLGAVHRGGTAYALIEAGKQVHCVALKAALPSYPITVAAIADHAVVLDRRLPDGSHRRSTLRQGE